MTTESTVPSTHSTPHQASSQPAARRLYRSGTNRVLAGVCGGIAAYYGSDPTAVRLATLVIGLFTGVIPMIVLYVVAAIVVPEGGDAPGEGARTGVAPGRTALVLGALLIVVGLAGLGNVWFHVAWDQVWPLVIIGLGAAIVFATIRPRP